MMSRRCLLMALLAIGLRVAVPLQLPAQATDQSQIAAERKLADKLYENGKTEEAKAIYQRLAPSFADDFEFNKRLGDCFFVSPKREMVQAARYYARAYQLNPNDPQVEMNLGKSYSWSKQYEAAISIFRRITTRNPDNPNGWLELARAQNYAGQVQAASTTYRSYLNRWFNDGETRLEFAAFLSWNKQLMAALEQYRAVLKISPNNWKARLGEAEVLSWQGNLEESLQAYNNILLLLPNRYEALRGRAFVLLWLQRYEEAGKAFAEANRQKPPDRDIQEALRQIARWKAEESVRQAQAELDALRQQVEEAMAQNELSRAIELLHQAIARTPDDKSLRLRLGQAHLWNRQWSEAIEIFQQLYTTDSQNLEALRELGHAQVGANRLAEAAATFRTYLQHSPDPAVRLTLARVLSWAGKIEEAIPVYQQILESEPDHFDASLGLAQVLSWQGQYEKALGLYEALLSRRPGSRESLLGKAQSLYWSGSIEKALVMLETMRETWPQDQELAGILQSVREAEQQRAAQRAAAPPPVEVDELISQYQEMLSRNSKDSNTLEMLGDLYLQKNDYPQAILYYERLLEQEPTDTPLRLKVAKAAGWNRDYPRAISLYQDLLAQDPDNREYRMELARNLNWAGRHSEHMEQYREILKRVPEDREARLALARELSWNQQLAESLQEYERLLQSAPGDRDALVERARVLSWKGELDAALNLYDDVLIRVPEDRDARFGKAQVLYWSGRLRDAQAILEELQALYPEDRDVALTAAGVQAGLGRTGLALRRLDELDKLQPGNAEVQSMRQHLRQDLRPALILGFTPSIDAFDLKIYYSTSTLYFSPTPQLRSHVFVGIIPSNDPNGGVETGREMLFGTNARVNDQLLLRGEAGVNWSTTTNRREPIGGGGVTLFATEKMRFDFDASRRFINYIPQPLRLGINRVELRTGWDWRPTRQTTFHVDYFHQRYSDTNRNNGVNFSVTRNLVRNERLELEAGYLYAASGFSKNINSGFFAPSQFQRHAGLLNLHGKMARWLDFSFWGSLGREQVFRDPFRFDATGRAAWNFTPSNHFKFSLGYGYFAITSIATAGAYRTHTGYATLEFRF